MRSFAHIAILGARVNVGLRRTLLPEEDFTNVSTVQRNFGLGFQMATCMVTSRSTAMEMAERTIKGLIKWTACP